MEHQSAQVVADRRVKTNLDAREGFFSAIMIMKRAETKPGLTDAILVEAKPGPTSTLGPFRMLVCMLQRLQI